MPWLRGEATGLPGLRTANLQRDHRSRLESSSFRAMEDVNRAFLCVRSMPVEAAIRRFADRAPQEIDRAVAAGRRRQLRVIDVPASLICEAPGPVKTERSPDCGLG